MKGGRASPVSSFGGTRKKGQVYVSRSRSCYVGVRARDIGKLAHLKYGELLSEAGRDRYCRNRCITNKQAFRYIVLLTTCSQNNALPLLVPPIFSHTE